MVNQIVIHSNRFYEDEIDAFIWSIFFGNLFHFNKVNPAYTSLIGQFKYAEDKMFDVLIPTALRKRN